MLHKTYSIFALTLTIVFVAACQTAARTSSSSEKSTTVTDLPSFKHLDLAAWNRTPGCCTAKGKKYAIASGGVLSSKAGAEMFEKGGNIVDAGVATAFALAAERVQSAGLGGGGFMTLHFQGKDYFIDFRETAPRKAAADMFLDKKGEVIPNLSTDGPLAVATPGLVAGLYDVHQRWGKLPWKTLLGPAIRIANEGFPATVLLVDRIDFRKDLLFKDGLTRKLLMPNGKPLAVGDPFVQKDLAESLKLIAKSGKQVFYTGALAKKMARHLKKLGGILDEKDLAAYQVRFREPIKGKIKDYTFIAAPPESAGGVLLTEMFNVLDTFDLGVLALEPAKYNHLLSEVMMRAYADRSGYVGDPDFVTTPYLKLLTPQYASALRQSIRLDRTTSASDVRPGALLPKEGKGTTQVSILDAQGNGLSATMTLNIGAFGSGVLVPETGIFLNNEMDDFSSKPGQRNVYGLVGNEANAVHRNKRPVSSLVPTLFFRNGKPVLAVGAGGGPRITSSVFQVALNYFFVSPGDLKQAVFAPRIHHQWQPDTLYVEPGFSERTIAQLKSLGHDIEVSKVNGEVDAVACDEKNNQMMAVFDPRSAGGAEAR